MTVFVAKYNWTGKCDMPARVGGRGWTQGAIQGFAAFSASLVLCAYLYPDTSLAHQVYGRQVIFIKRSVFAHLNPKRLAVAKIGDESTVMQSGIGYGLVFRQGNVVINIVYGGLFQNSTAKLNQFLRVGRLTAYRLR